MIIMFFVIFCTSFLQGSTDDLFAAERTSRASSRSSSPASRPTTPETLALQASQQEDLLREKVLDCERKYLSASIHKSQWKWHICESTAQVLLYGSVAIFLLNNLDHFHRMISIAPIYLTTVSAFMLTCEYKHFNTCKRDMHDATNDAADYLKDYQKKSFVSHDFMQKIEARKKFKNICNLQPIS